VTKHLDEAVAVVFAEQTGDAHAFPEVCQAAGDVDAFAARIALYLMRQIQRPRHQLRQTDGLVDCRIQRDGNDFAFQRT